jgi:hypothetical protein
MQIRHEEAYPAERSQDAQHDSIRFPEKAVDLPDY